MIGSGLTVIRWKVLPLEVVKVVNFSAFDLNMDLTVYFRFQLFYIIWNPKPIIFDSVGLFVYSQNTV